MHTFPEEFRDLIAIVADRKHLLESAIGSAKSCARPASERSVPLTTR